MRDLDVLIVGGGPAGLAAACAAYDAGCRSLAVVERESSAGGILKQCIHPGFGLHTFGKELTGPEYANEYKKMALDRGIDIITDTFVTRVEKGRVTLRSKVGVQKLNVGATVLAMGCRERPRGALNVPGTRPSGIFTAGSAQRLVNIEGYMPGKRAVILGSGDIGLIMARRMTLEGARVEAVCEIMPYSGGLARNIEQCLNDFGIPLYLSTTVTAVHGKERLTGVTVARVDESRQPVPGSERFIECDTLLLSVGLIPENELTLALGAKMDPVTGGPMVDENRMTSVEGVFAAGNVLHVHDLVDFVSKEAAIAGRAAALYAMGKDLPGADIGIVAEGSVRYTVPGRISAAGAEIYLRVGKCERNVRIKAMAGGITLAEKKIARAAPGEMISIDVKNIPDTVEKITVIMEKDGKQI